VFNIFCFHILAKYTKKLAKYILLDAHHLSNITKLKKSLVRGVRKNAKEAKKTIIGYIHTEDKTGEKHFLSFSQLPTRSAWQLDSQKE